MTIINASRSVVYGVVETAKFVNKYVIQPLDKRSIEISYVSGVASVFGLILSKITRKQASLGGLVGLCFFNHGAKKVYKNGFHKTMAYLESTIESYKSVKEASANLEREVISIKEENAKLISSSRELRIQICDLENSSESIKYHSQELARIKSEIADATTELQTIRDLIKKEVCEAADKISKIQTEADDQLKALKELVDSTKELESSMRSSRTVDAKALSEQQALLDLLSRIRGIYERTRTPTISHQLSIIKSRKN